MRKAKPRGFSATRVTVQHLDTKRTQTRRKGDRRSINGRIGLRVPHDVIEAKCHHYLRGGKAVHRAELTMESDFTIVSTYQLEFRGLANYYRLAYNLHRLNRLKQVMEISLTKTLAHKFQVSVPTIYGRYGATLVVDGKQYKGLQVVLPRPDKKPLVAEWGGVSLAWDIKASAEDQPPKVHHGGRSELVQRLLASYCELCGSTEDVEVHHLRKMSDLHKRSGRRKEPWEVRMIALKRKTLVLCRTCHTDVDLGRPLRRAVIGLAEVKALRKRANATMPESRVR